MASALLASSRNEPFWGEPQVYMRKNPSPNPNPRFASDNRSKDRLRGTPASSPFVNRIDDAAEIEEPTSPVYGAVSAASEDDSSSLNHHHRTCPKPIKNHIRSSGNGSGFEGAYVTLDIATYSRRERRDLKRRLLSELDQVRSLSSRIETGEAQPARSTCLSTSGHGGGREVTSAAVDLDSHRRFNASDLRAAESPTAGRADHDKYSGKRTLPLVSPRESKRQATGESEKILAAMMKKCGQILTKLMKHRFGWVFNTPVDVQGLGLHDYYQIIKRPMDLGTVKSRLDQIFYTSPLDFAADVRLTFNNALLYNPDGHDVHKMAQQLLNLFEKLFSDACKAYEKQGQSYYHGRSEEEGRKQSHPRSGGHLPQEEATSRHALPPANSATPPAQSPGVAPSPLPRPAHAQPVASPTRPDAPAQQPALARPAAAKQPKPKAKDPNKREMSFEEKKKLSLGLQSLPQEKMTQVLQIVQRRNPDPALHGDEIELDFEVLDTETLWELDRFVGNCKKMMSKIKRQEAMSTAGSGPPPNWDAAASSAEKNPPVGAETSETGKRSGKKAGEVGEEDVDIGEEMPSSHFPPVEIDKDNNGNRSDSSSSSSSSGSDSSSSSDSDSRSSAESDSDGDDAQSPAVD